MEFETQQVVRPAKNLSPNKFPCVAVADPKSTPWGHWSERIVQTACSLSFIRPMCAWWLSIWLSSGTEWTLGEWRCCLWWKESGLPCAAELGSVTGAHWSPAVGSKRNRSLFAQYHSAALVEICTTCPETGRTLRYRLETRWEMGQGFLMDGSTHWVWKGEEMLSGEWRGKCQADKGNGILRKYRRVRWDS